MRFTLDIAIGGAALADDETGTAELARIMQTLGFAILNGRLAQVGDEATLYDYNGNAVGLARMVPDWTPGESVWVTTDEGTHLKSTIEAVEHAPAAGAYVAVRCRYTASHELLSWVTVDPDGRDQLGRPTLARVLS